MSQLNPTTPDDIEVHVDAETGTVSAQEDAYDLYDRSALYAKGEQYSNKELSQEWTRPASSSSEVGADKIQDFDTFDDHTVKSMSSLQNPNDIHKGHPPPDRSCLPKDLDLSSLLIKERRTKKFLLLLCLFLSVACITLLCNPRKYSSDQSMNDPALRSSSGQSAYNIRTNDNTDLDEGISVDSSNQYINDKTNDELEGDAAGLPNQERLAIQSKFRTLNKFSQSYAKDDLPILWSIPKSGSDLVEDVMMQCFKLVGASNEGDMASDVGITPKIYEGAALFTNDNSREGQPEQLGECFVILRDPIDRAIAVFSQLKTSPRWENVNIVSYAKGAEIENNWMTRSITGKLNGGEVTEVDLLAAKEFLLNYCVIGTLDELAESVRQFANTFGWKTSDEQPDRFSPCVAKALRKGLKDERLTYQRNVIGENSYLHDLISKSNVYDTQLFAYAKQLAEKRKLA